MLGRVTCLFLLLEASPISRRGAAARQSRHKRLPVEDAMNLRMHQMYQVGDGAKIDFRGTTVVAPVEID